MYILHLAPKTVMTNDDIPMYMQFGNLLHGEWSHTQLIAYDTKHTKRHDFILRKHCPACLLYTKY